MNLRTYEPQLLLNRLQDELGRVFDPQANLSELTSSNNVWAPAVDIKEEEHRYLIHADLPGVKAEDIDITLEHGVLTIKGSREQETSENRQGYHRIERNRGRFIRSFALPDSVDNEKVDAHLKEGVLEVVIDKKERAKPRRIAVKH